MLPTFESRQVNRVEHHAPVVARRRKGGRARISRKTGYKIFTRYREHGAEALTDRSRRPMRYANQLHPPIGRTTVYPT